MFTPNQQTSSNNQQKKKKKESLPVEAKGKFTINIRKSDSLQLGRQEISKPPFFFLSSFFFFLLPLSYLPFQAPLQNLSAFFSRILPQALQNPFCSLEFLTVLLGIPLSSMENPSISSRLSLTACSPQKRSSF